MPKFLSTRLRILKGNLKIFLTLICVFALGVVLGILFNIRSGNKISAYDNVLDFYKRIFGSKFNAFSLEIKFLINCTLMTAVFFLLSIIKYALAIGYAALFFRGLIVGGALVVIVGVYGISGIPVLLLINVVQTIVSCACLCALLSVNFNLFCVCKSVKIDLKFKIITACVCLCVFALAAVYGVLALIFFIKPLYSVF